MLWGASAAGWAATFAADAANAPDHIWMYALGGALLATQAALLATLIAARLDYAYIAMARAFIQREAPAPEPHGRHAALMVVRGQGKARP